MKIINSVFEIEHNNKLYRIKYIKKSKFVYSCSINDCTDNKLIFSDEGLSYGVVSFETAVLALCAVLCIDYEPKKISWETK